MAVSHKAKNFLILALAASILANIILVALLYDHTLSTHGKKSHVKEEQEKYPLLGKRRLIKEYNSDLIVNFLPLRQQLRSQTDPYKNDFAFYFEYLPTGTSVGLNEDSEFTAASLLKVPITMAYFYKKERLGIQDDPVVKIQNHQLDNTYGELYKKGVGYEINVADAIKLALQESDNTANRIVVDQITNEDFDYVYKGLDIEPATEGNSPIITAQQYASILKALYFSSVLKKEDSQMILDLMSHTKFNDKLRAGVPDDINVAHKIGLINEQIYQDCGIVYVPNRNYMLCMISKSDENMARERMKSVSKTIYDYVSSVQKLE